MRRVSRFTIVALVTVIVLLIALAEMTANAQTFSIEVATRARAEARACAIVRSPLFFEFDEQGRHELASACEDNVALGRETASITTPVSGAHILAPMTTFDPCTPTNPTCIYVYWERFPNDPRALIYNAERDYPIMTVCNYMPHAPSECETHDAVWCVAKYGARYYNMCQAWPCTIIGNPIFTRVIDGEKYWLVWKDINGTLPNQDTWAWKACTVSARPTSTTQ